MNIQIEIDCETVDELLSHLSVIKTEVRKEAKRLKLDFAHDEFPDYQFQDSNCYGEHYVIIKEAVV